MLLLCSKYNLYDVTVNSFECGSGRPYVTYKADINGKTINFIICHLSIESESTGIRQQELSELATKLNTYEYGVLSGDFNTFSIDEYDIFEGFNMANHRDFGDFPTWNHESGGWNKCIDNIITTSNITIQNVEMPEVGLSDHSPLIAELNIY